MNVQVLIDSIVRQTTILIAQLATSGGIRAPLAHVANQVFLDLAGELENQGVSRKVSADMFGLALRSYLRKIRQLSESSTERGRSLWEAVLDYVTEAEVVTRAEVLQRFHRDDEALVRAVLRDLVESGLVFASSTGPGTAYRAATEEELGRLRAKRGGNDELIWAIVYREGPLSRAALEQRTRLAAPGLDESLARLLGDQRVRLRHRGGETLYESATFVIPLEAPAGWEAALFDHFQAVVKTMVSRLRQHQPSPMTGGSTYTFEVWPGHPMEDEARTTLQRFRESCSDLRARVADYNAGCELPASRDRVIVYAGQCIVGEEPLDADGGR